MIFIWIFIEMIYTFLNNDWLQHVCRELCFPMIFIMHAHVICFFHIWIRHKSEDGLYQDWSSVFNILASNAKQLAPAASTKDVGWVNNLYASKAPNRTCYSTSSNLRTYTWIEYVYRYQCLRRTSDILIFQPIQSQLEYHRAKLLQNTGSYWQNNNKDRKCIGNALK